MVEAAEVVPSLLQAMVAAWLPMKAEMAEVPVEPVLPVAPVTAADMVSTRVKVSEFSA